MLARSTTPLLTVLLLLLGGARLPAQEPGLDPCASTVTSGQLRLCWAREVERANQEMRAAFTELLAAFPRSRADDLKKAQKLWVLFRDAHIHALYGERRHDPERFTCSLIAERQLTRARTAELKRMLQESGDSTVCPL